MPISPANIYNKINLPKVGPLVIVGHLIMTKLCQIDLFHRKSRRLLKVYMRYPHQTKYIVFFIPLTIE